MVLNAEGKTYQDANEKNLHGREDTSGQGPYDYTQYKPPCVFQVHICFLLPSCSISVQLNGSPSAYNMTF